jgi:hypothetical protein
MNYNDKDLIQLLDKDVIRFMFQLYDIGYKHIALKLRCTVQNITYKQRTDSWYPHERKMLLDLFRSYGMEIAELMLIHQMTSKAKNTTKKVD